MAAIFIDAMVIRGMRARSKCFEKAKCTDFVGHIRDILGHIRTY